MSRVTIKKQIAASPAVAFARATDLARAPQVMSGIVGLEVLTPGPVGVGTRFRETRRMFNREATEEMTITRFEAPSCYVVECVSCGCRYESVFHFAPHAVGCEVSMEVSAEGLTPFARILGRMMGPILLKSCAQACEADLDDLKRALEGRATPVAARA